MEETYEIECLEDHKVGSDGKTYLLVKWVGFAEAENTWEPIETLREDVPNLVKKYLEDREERKQKRKQKKRKHSPPHFPQARRRKTTPDSQTRPSLKDPRRAVPKRTSSSMPRGRRPSRSPRCTTS